MALNSSQVTGLTDSVSQALSDFNTCFVANTGTSTPSSTTIINGVSGTTTSNTLGRILNYVDIVPELNMLTAANTMATNVTAYVGGLQAISGFYPQFYPLFDKLDSTLTSGLNAFLTANSIQVNARFAIAFNYWASIATSVTPGRTSSNAPVAITTANFFPYAATDSLWTFTCGTGASMTLSAVGTNTSTTVNGGGVGQMYLYKANATNAIGGATLTVTYTTATGSSTTATYTTTSGVPLASGSLAAGYSITTAIGSAVTGVTGTGMTSGEQYVIGMKLVRALSGY